MSFGRAASRLLPILILLVLGLQVGTADAAPHNMLLGFGDIKYASPKEAVRRDALDKTVAVDGDIVRVNAGWGLIAPDEKTPSFDPRDPASPEYDWSRLDAAVQDASDRGLQILLLVQNAPTWAEGKNRPPDAFPGIWKPSPKALGDFATALARRYSGTFEGLPRVRYFECWGEANLKVRLAPLWGGKDGKKPIVVDRYRKMLNAFYKGIHSAVKSNVVVTAALSPYGAQPGLVNVRPLQFWRPLLCVKDNKQLSPVRHCKKVHFDVLAHNPIGHGPPGTKAVDHDDISVPDLHRLVDVLRASEKAHNVKPAVRHPVWATELWWESRPPDPYKGNPGLMKQAAWYTKANYMLWRQGASLSLLLQVIDLPYNGTPGRGDDNLQTGVYFEDGTPKPSATAMRFPFLVDSRKDGKVVVWGKSPASGTLAVTEKGKSKPVERFHVRADRIFLHKIRLGGKHKRQLRAEVGAEKSLYWTVR